MISRAMLLLAALILPACRERAAETGRTASAYSNGGDSAGGAGLKGTAAGVEYEAPRLIPGMRAQLELYSSPGRRLTDSDVTNYKNTAGTLINAMQADLTRVGLADSGAFKTLSDSVLNELGGGTGVPHGVSGERLSQNLAQMRRLIGVYQQWMRGTEP
jgi:hypothetical protein